jgi:hypothetical protein
MNVGFGPEGECGVRRVGFIFIPGIFLRYGGALSHTSAGWLAGRKLCVLGHFETAGLHMMCRGQG